MNTSRRNPFEVALWILAVVLILGSIGTIVYVVPRMFATTSGSSGSRVLENLVYIAFPGAFAAGLVCLAMALAVRAIDVNARRRFLSVAEVAGPSPLIESPAPAGTSAPVIPEPIGEPAPATRRAAFARPQSPDPSIFMRPRD